MNPKKAWGFITSYEPCISTQYLYNAETTLWIRSLKNGDQKTYTKVLPSSLTCIERRGECKVLKITRNKTEAGDDVISTTIRRVQGHKVIVDSQPLDGDNQNEITISKRKVELNVDDNILFLTHCKDVDEIHIPDQVFDDHVLVGKMAKTGLAKLYKLKRKNGDELRVLKVARGTSNEMNVFAAESALEMEIAILHRCKHENIIKLVAADTHPLKRHLIIEYAAGGTLNDRRMNTELDARLVSKQILSAVRYLHASSIVHRDIKPENVVFMTPNSMDRVKLIDFGLSCALPECGELIEAVGTFHFMAPIVMNNLLHPAHQAPYTEKTDIWPFGVTLYYSLTKTYPFRHKSNRVKYAREAGEGRVQTVDKFNSLSEKCRLFITACLEVDEHKRPSAHELLTKFKWITMDEV